MTAYSKEKLDVKIKEANLALIDLRRRLEEETERVDDQWRQYGGGMCPEETMTIEESLKDGIERLERDIQRLTQMLDGRLDLDGLAASLRQEIAKIETARDDYGEKRRRFSLRIVQLLTEREQPSDGASSPAASRELEETLRTAIANANQFVAESDDRIDDLRRQLADVRALQSGLQ